MLCVLILYISGGNYSLKSTPKDRLFKKLFMATLFILRVFARNLPRGHRQRNIFRTLFWCLHSILIIIAEEKKYFIVIGKCFCETIKTPIVFMTTEKKQKYSKAIKNIVCLEMVLNLYPQNADNNLKKKRKL